MQLIALFNLKPGITVGEYEAWARGTDLPIVNNLPSVHSFRVFKTLGLLGGDATPPYSHIEIIEIADMEMFGRDVATATMQKVAAAFATMADVIFMTADEIKP